MRLSPSSRFMWVLLVNLALPEWAQGDQAQEDGVKAGFIFNFAKYTEWPTPGHDASSLRICALGRNPLGGQLNLLQGRLLQGREIVIRTKVTPAEISGCHLVLVTAADGESAISLFKGLTGVPVLTVGDFPGFAEKGGMIELRMADNRMRFHVNLGATERAGLKMSSQMLKLAEQVWK